MRQSTRMIHSRSVPQHGAQSGQSTAHRPPFQQLISGQRKQKRILRKHETMLDLPSDCLYQSNLQT
jgi:hypothetical protein